METKALLITLCTGSLLWAQETREITPQLSPFNVNTAAITLPHEAEKCNTYSCDIGTTEWNLKDTQLRRLSGDTITFTGRTEKHIFVVNTNKQVTYATKKKWSSETDAWQSVGKTYYYKAEYTDSEKLLSMQFSSSKAGPANGITEKVTFSYNETDNCIGTERTYKSYAPRNQSSSSATKHFEKLLNPIDETISLTWQGNSSSYNQMHGTKNYTHETTLIVTYNASKKIERIEETILSICDKTPEDTSYQSNSYRYSYDNGVLTKEELWQRFEKESDDSLARSFVYRYESGMLSEMEDDSSLTHYRYEKGRLAEMIRYADKTTDTPMEKKIYTYSPTAVVSEKPLQSSSELCAVSVTNRRITVTPVNPSAEQLSLSLRTLQGRRVLEQQNIPQGVTTVALPSELSAGIYLLSIAAGSREQQLKVTLP